MLINSSEVRIGFAGDLIIKRPLSTVGSRASTSFDKVLSSCDAIIANLECGPVIGPELSLLRQNAAWLVPELSRVGIRILSCANNHIGDFGDTGIRSTIAALTESNIEFAGISGETCDTPKSAEFTSCELEVSLFSLNDSLNETSSRVNAGQLGNTLQPDAIKDEIPQGVSDAISNAVSTGQFVVVSIHSHRVDLGSEIVDPALDSWVSSMVELGVGLVWIQGSHSIKPITVKDDVPVFWGLGSFVLHLAHVLQMPHWTSQESKESESFSIWGDPALWVSLFPIVTVNVASRTIVDVEIHPLELGYLRRIGAGDPMLAAPQVADSILEMLRDISPSLDTKWKSNSTFKLG